MKLAPRAAVPKLTSQSVYRSLAFEPGTWTIGCFLVHPEYRQKGVARALVEAAETIVASWGGRFLEAHPRRSEVPLHDEEAWQGPERLFIERGWAKTHAMEPYPVYRKVIDPPKT
jgi:GNAT superfamily N-acetyltransferase